MRNYIPLPFKTNKGKRLVVVPKKQYDKIKTGEKVKIKNSVLQ